MSNTRGLDESNKDSSNKLAEVKEDELEISNDKEDGLSVVDALSHDDLPAEDEPKKTHVVEQSAVHCSEVETTVHEKDTEVFESEVIDIGDVCDEEAKKKADEENETNANEKRVSESQLEDLAEKCPVDEDSRLTTVVNCVLGSCGDPRVPEIEVRLRVDEFNDVLVKAKRILA